MTFLLGRQATFTHYPPMSVRSTTAVRLPPLAIAQAINLSPRATAKNKHLIMVSLTHASDLLHRVTNVTVVRYELSCQAAMVSTILPLLKEVTRMSKTDHYEVLI